MSIARTIGRGISKRRTANAYSNTRRCPVCGFAMKDVWYSKKTRVCTRSKCGTSVKVPLLKFWKEACR